MHQLWRWVTEYAVGISAVSGILTTIFTGFYLVATIRIFREAKKSADAATDSARAAITSANLSAVQHRPHMGVLSASITKPEKGTWKTADPWFVEWSIKNFGNLPAIRVHATLQVEDGPNGKGLTPPEVAPLFSEIYPQSQPFEWTAILPFDAKQRSDFVREVQQLWLKVIILYAGPTGDSYRYRANLWLDQKRGTFTIFDSDTEALSTDEAREANATANAAAAAVYRDALS